MTDLKSYIDKANKILILPHVRPDGDAIGSSIGLLLGLESLDKECVIHSLDELPFFYSKIFNDKPYIKKEIDFIPDLIIAVDSSDFERIKDRHKYINVPLIVIDHHVTNNGFGDLSIVEKNSSSTGEIIYKILKSLGIEINKNIAKAIYVAIASDTGCFMYSNTGVETFLITSELMKTEFNRDEINTTLFMSTPIEKFELSSEALSNAEFSYENKVAICVVDNDLIQKYNTDNTDDIAESLRNIEGVEVSALIVKRIDGYKVSLRSKAFVDLSIIALKNGGGGHSRAAGYTSNLQNVEDIKSLLLNELRACFD
jgi:phosphoesterase RecJ-like protein